MIDVEFQQKVKDSEQKLQEIRESITDFKNATSAPNRNISRTKELKQRILNNNQDPHLMLSREINPLTYQTPIRGIENIKHSIDLINQTF